MCLKTILCKEEKEVRVVCDADDTYLGSKSSVLYEAFGRVRHDHPIFLVVIPLDWHSVEQCMACDTVYRAKIRRFFGITLFPFWEHKLPR